MKVDLRVYGLVGGPATPDPIGAAIAAAKGGATLIQLREKQMDSVQLTALGRDLKAALEPYKVPLLINDFVAQAKDAGADGVHLGQGDMAVREARAILGDEAIIGLTLKSAAHVDAADMALLDYVAIGGVFETGSKVNPDAPVGLDGLARLAARVRSRAPHMPITAIAGIDADNAAQVIEAGAGGIAVISSLFGADDITARASQLRGLVDDALEKRKSR